MRRGVGYGYSFKMPVNHLLYGIFLSIVTCFFWGNTSLLLRGIRKLDAVQMSFTRACGALLCSAAIVSFVGKAQLMHVSASEAALFSLLVLCNNVLGDVFLFFAIHLLGIARGAAISSTYPILVALASYLFFHSPLTLHIAAGTLSVVLGVGLLCHREKEEKKLSFAGLLSAAAASFFWAAGLLLNKELLVRGINPATIVMGRGITFFIISSLILFSRALLIKRDPGEWREFLRRETLLGAAAGASSLALGAWFYSLALQYVPPTVATPIGASNPVLAALLSTVIYKEKIYALQWAGILLAVGGAVLVAL